MVEKQLCQMDRRFRKAEHIPLPGRGNSGGVTKGSFIHTAPSLKKVCNKWEKLCVGTTTSTRMDPNALIPICFMVLLGAVLQRSHSIDNAFIEKAIDLMHIVI